MSKAKPLTVKDVLYATQFAGEQINRVRDLAPGKVAYRLEPSGTVLPKAVASEIMSKHYKEVAHAIVT